MIDDGHRTETTRAQFGLEKKLIPRLQAFGEATAEEKSEDLTLKRDIHVEYIKSHLGELPEEFAALHASQTWIIYWMVHSLDLLGAPLSQSKEKDELVETLWQCQAEDGGFGGGPGQLPHLAATYAAVMSLIILGSPDIVDRAKLEVNSPS